MRGKARDCSRAPLVQTPAHGDTIRRIDAMLQIDGLTKRYGDRAVLHALSLSVDSGEYVAIVGESGSGKSTLLNLIAGLDRPEAGRVEIEGTDIAQLEDTARTLLRRSKLGFVFQAFHILPHLTVVQNVALPLVLLGVTPDERGARAAALLGEVGLAGREASMPRELSGGELQRVAVARALVHRPALVLADEPTGNLDPDTADVVLQLLTREIHSRHSAGVLVTHSEAAAASADRVLHLNHGHLVPYDGARR
jgi:putative ABC transport system ATP-binding protein